MDKEQSRKVRCGTWKIDKKRGHPQTHWPDLEAAVGWQSIAEGKAGRVPSYARALRCRQALLPTLIAFSMPFASVVPPTTYL